MLFLPLLAPVVTFLAPPRCLKATSLSLLTMPDCFFFFSCSLSCKNWGWLEVTVFVKPGWRRQGRKKVPGGHGADRAAENHKLRKGWRAERVQRPPPSHQKETLGRRAALMKHPVPGSLADCSMTEAFFKNCCCCQKLGRCLPGSWAPPGRGSSGALGVLGSTGRWEARTGEERRGQGLSASLVTPLDP